MIELKSIGNIRTRKNKTKNRTNDDLPIILLCTKEYYLCFCYYDIGIVLNRKENVAEDVKRITIHGTEY